MKTFILYCFLLFSFTHIKAQPVTYHQNIQPIIQSHCLPCHSKNNIGPIPLTNYQEVAAYGSMVGYVTANNIMPPWRADNKYAPLKDHNTLSEAEIAGIKKWVANGFAEGDTGKEIKETAHKKEKDSSRILTAAMQQAFLILPDYTETAQVFVLDIRTKKNEWISAVKFTPGNKRLVKTCSISLDTGRTGTLYDSYDEKYGYSSQVGLSYIPSQYYWYQWTAEQADSFFRLPAPVQLPAASRLLLHVTYAASDTIEKDSSFVQLKLSGGNPGSNQLYSGILVDTGHITNPPFVINKGDKKKAFALKKLGRDETIVSLMPMGQFALSSWEIYAINSKTGIRIPLLKIPHWDAHWKKKYYLEQPIQLPAGSTIHATAYYNNSDDNRSLIILPPKQIKYGEGQRDELFLVQYDYLLTGNNTFKK